MRTRLFGALLLLATPVALVASGSGTAAELQPIGAAGHPRTGSQGIRESVAEIVARQRREDRRSGGRPRDIREKPEPGERGRQPQLPGPVTPQSQVPAPPRAGGGPSAPFPAGTSFLGAQINESGFVPPDSMGSVGPTQALVAVNGRIKVFSKTGTLGALNVSDLTFWSSVRNSPESSSPTQAHS